MLRRNGPVMKPVESVLRPEWWKDLKTIGHNSQTIGRDSPRGRTEPIVSCTAVTPKAFERLYRLKQLNRAGIAGNALMCFFHATVRPFLEYAYPAWHTSFTKEQCNSSYSFLF